MESIPSRLGASWSLSLNRMNGHSRPSLSFDRTRRDQVKPQPKNTCVFSPSRWGRPRFGSLQPQSTLQTKPAKPGGLATVMDWGTHPWAKAGFILSCLATWVVLALIAPAQRAQPIPTPTATPTPDPRIPDFPGREDLQGLIYENTLEEGDKTVVYALYRFGDEVKGKRLNAEEAIRIEMTLNGQGELQQVSYNLNPFYSYHPGGAGYETHMEAADAFRQWVAGSIAGKPFTLLDETQDPYPGRNYLRVMPNQSEQ